MLSERRGGIEKRAEDQDDKDDKESSRGEERDIAL